MQSSSFVVFETRCSSVHRRCCRRRSGLVVATSAVLLLAASCPTLLPPPPITTMTMMAHAMQIQLRTRAPIQRSAVELHDFLSRPVHWPQIVASSDRVAAASFTSSKNKNQSNNFDVNKPLKPGCSVEEYFGLGLLCVTWTCRQSKSGSLLVVESPNGVPGIAKDCRMQFDFDNQQQHDDVSQQPQTKVTLTMSYESTSPLAVLAIPVLIVDNFIALNVLLPAVVDPYPLDTFRKLMGTLYGIAGIAHAIDLWLGDSILLTSNGIAAYASLPPAGQALAVLWCATGPLAWWSTTRTATSSPRQIGKSSSAAAAFPSGLAIEDSGLIMYGVVESLGAWLSDNHEAFTSAIAVQVIVALAWIYSNQKQKAKAATMKK